MLIVKHFNLSILIIIYVLLIIQNTW